jgi:hypothetical protein
MRNSSLTPPPPDLFGAMGAIFRAIAFTAEKQPSKSGTGGLTMADCKAWIVRENGEPYAAVVFAETRGKARALAQSTDACDYVDFVNIEVHRIKDADKYYKPGKRELDWDNADDRIALVKDCGFVCDHEYWDMDDCAVCPAKDFCDKFFESERTDNG